MGPWFHGFGPLWQRLRWDYSVDMERNKSSHIHNPAIWYFCYSLAYTIFGRDNNGSVNSKELFLIHCMFQNTLVHITAFMLSHMCSVSNAKR